jgi:eukaryotic-like serine/threonine-protein kinase
MPFSPNTVSVQEVLADVLLRGEIARGGQKIVFLAESPQFGRIAVKLIQPGSDSAEKRAQREIQVAQSIEDPHFPRIFLAKKVTIDNAEVLCIYEEYLDGEPLRSALQREGRLSARETFRIAVELVVALEILRARDVVHRDVKPENIYLVSDGRVVLLDLGIARQLGDASLTDDYAMFGPLTPGYGAPEQIGNQKRNISSRTDIFALGVVMHECLSGQNPFAQPGDSPVQTLHNTMTVVPARLDAVGVSRQMADVVCRSLEKSAHRRFPTPSALLRELQLCPEANQ